MLLLRRVIQDAEGRGVLLRLGLSPAGSALASAFTVAILAVATRQGQLPSIAGYGAGVSVVSLAAVIGGGGTTLTYASSGLEIQRAVRQFRVAVILPLLIVASLIAWLLYSSVTGINVVDVLLGCVAGIGNNLSEIENSFLRRRLRTPSSVASDVTARVGGLAIVMFGGSFAAAMAAVALSRFALLAFFAREDPSRVGVWEQPLHASAKRAINPSLAGVTILYVVLDRLGYSLAPLIAAPAVAGAFASLLSAQQAVSGVLVTGLQTSLAARVESTANARWARHFEGITIGVSAIAALTLAAAAKPILNSLRLPPSELTVLWVVLCLAIPAAVASRTMQFRAISRQAQGVALFGLVAGVIVLICFGSAALWSGRLLILTFGIVAGEVASVMVAATLLSRTTSTSVKASE